ncbi:alpha/beta fold hydrolase [Azospirillum soli]|uniref:alpha/beta fold hydrolase n=1 Tax=Azospirillum soli TaxID=1304799 RepID=UPI001AE73FCF|nr:alpha/beta hydrolase [Azospirillum soli]MBP2313211.1 lysophospholipase [Azospirillum soli]
MAETVAELRSEPLFDWLTLDDGTRLRTARWQAGRQTADGTPRGTVLLLNGRSEFVEKYAETAGELQTRGFQVVSFDWRNQGLSDRPLANRQIHHLDSFDTLVDDLDAVFERVVRPVAVGPVVLMGHSMGGLVATLNLARHPERYRAAVLSAPMYDIFTGPVPRSAAVWLAERFCGWGRAEAYAFGQRDYDPVEGLFTPANAITSDPRRYAVYHDAFRERPELRLGGVSFGWVRAALRAAGRLREAPLERVTAPVLLLSAPRDAVVRAEAHRAVAARLPNAVLKEYLDAKHELLMERDDIRDRVWADIDAFLDRVLV